VYDNFSPLVYERRSSGGLRDKIQINTEVSKDGMSIRVTDDAPFNTAYGMANNVQESLAATVVSGVGYLYNVPFEGRDFMDTAERKLVASGDHIEAKKKGLQKEGYSVR
jgi:hypothetical protein